MEYVRSSTVKHSVLSRIHYREQIIGFSIRSRVHVSALVDDYEAGLNGHLSCDAKLTRESAGSELFGAIATVLTAAGYHASVAN